MAVPAHGWLTHVPHAFFNPPPGLPAFATGIPAAGIVIAANLLRATALIALLFGWRTRIASLVVAALTIALDAWAFSLGKIDHTILVAVAPLVLAFSGWGDMHSLDARRLAQQGIRRDLNDTSGSWALTMFAVIIAFAMATAGWGKIVTGWFDPAVHSTYGYLVSDYYVGGNPTPVGGVLMHIDSPLFWEGMDWAAACLEFGFIFSIVNARLFKTFCAVAALFHLSVWLMFGIDFSVNMLAYAVLLPYTELARWLSPRLAGAVQAARKIPMWLIAIVFVAVTAISIVIKQPVLEAIGFPGSVTTIWIGALAGAIYLLRQITITLKSAGAARLKMQPVPSEGKKIG